LGSVLISSLGLQDASDATIETLKAIDHPISKTAQIMVEACSFAGTGNVLKVQAMLHHCDEHIDTSKEKPKEKDGEKEKEKENKDENKDEAKGETKEEPKKDDTFQAFAVLAVALIAMGEDIGAEMSLRQFNHLVRMTRYTYIYLLTV
jgi:26S proteasome regulatory subunit N1